MILSGSSMFQGPSIYDSDSDSESRTLSSRGGVISIVRPNNQETIEQEICRGMRHEKNEANKILEVRLTFELKFEPDDTHLNRFSPEHLEVIDIVYEVKTESGTSVPREHIDNIVRAIWRTIAKYNIGYYQGGRITFD